MTEQFNGNEKFTISALEVGISLSDFWSWAYSDLINNTQRGILAEYIVFSSMYGIAKSNSRVRNDWMSYDILTPSGRRVEVKSAAYLQSWTKEYYSKILFDISPKHLWSPDEGYSLECKRNCDLYVFCIYTALTRDKSPLNLDLWDFYILPTSILNNKVAEQKTIALQSLLKLSPIKTDYSSLGQNIETLEL